MRRSMIAPLNGESEGDACDGERAADALHCPSSDSELLAMTRTPGRPRATSASWIRFSRVGAIEGGARGVYPHPWPGTDSYRNHPPLELGKNAYHLKQHQNSVLPTEPSCRGSVGAGIGRCLARAIRRNADQILQASAGRWTRP
jgi:hypothetical protein